MNQKEFNKLSLDKKKYLVNTINHLYIDCNNSKSSILKELNITPKLLNNILKENKIVKSKELINLSKSIGKYKSYQEHPEIKEKIKNTKLERYGDSNYNNRDKFIKTLNDNPDIKENMIKNSRKTHLQNHGVENPFQDITNMKRAFKEKFGVENPFQSKEIKEKIKRTNINKYGVEYQSQRLDVKEKRKNTLTRNGFTYDNNINKINKTCQEKYGVEWPCQLPQCVNKSNSISNINIKFAELLKENNIEYEQEYNLENKKFDFKVNNILIEINPTYTHNSTIGPYFNGKCLNPLPKNYHKEKSLLAQKYNFKCIHIFDWDDWNKIIYLLKPKQKIYARECKIKEISKQECDKFLNEYHLQNTCKNQSIKYGLYYDNDLVQVMTFGKPRYNKNYEYELLRLCSHKDYIIVGGSEKLFKHFLMNNSISNIISYCDNSKFSGDVYKRLGMKLKITSNPSCIWSKGKQKITQNLLNQRGFDQLFNTDYGKNTSNKDLMIKHEWREVYDCGQSTYVY